MFFLLSLFSPFWFADHNSLAFKKQLDNFKYFLYVLFDQSYREETFMGGGPVEQSRLHNDFKCRCQACDETMETDQADDPRVIIDRCGCIFRKTHLEASKAKK